ncbi:unnamed protein product [Gordionus sp. m RMFG-2023]|uniref:protein artemis-like n=1 Tax=Gordionus sp. m RMFG-2023 TaxID=3053472 RepID=UPI0030DED9DB
MKAFDGRIAHYPDISVDNFFDLNLSSQLYFLSHKHMDHMKGLDSAEFYTRISDMSKFDSFKQKRLFCSPVTKTLLYNDPKYVHISVFFQALSLYRPVLIRARIYDNNANIWDDRCDISKMQGIIIKEDENVIPNMEKEKDHETIGVIDHEKKLRRYYNKKNDDNETCKKLSDSNNNKSRHLTFMVTLIPAGHCPGSVMFNFESPLANVLYSGDFRFGEKFLSLKPGTLFGLDQFIKPGIDALYLDATFAVPEASFIPSREESCRVAAQLVKDWLNYGTNDCEDKKCNIFSDDTNSVNIKTKRFVRLNLLYDIGYEPLYASLHEVTHYKVHVSPYQYEYYRSTNVASYLTLNPTVTPLHACRFRPSNIKQSNNSKECKIEGCHENNINQDELNLHLCDSINSSEIEEFSSKVLIIQPSVMWWNQTLTTKKIYSKVRNFYRLCFSMHPSYGEISKFLAFVRPKEIFPIAKPMNCDYYRLNRILHKCVDDAKQFGFDETGTSSKFLPRSFIKGERRKRRLSNDLSSSKYSQESFEPMNEILPFFYIFDELPPVSSHDEDISNENSSAETGDVHGSLSSHDNSNDSLFLNQDNFTEEINI